MLKLTYMKKPLSVKPNIRFYENIVTAFGSLYENENCERIIITSKKLYALLGLSTLKGLKNNPSREIILDSDGEKCKSFASVKKIISGLLNHSSCKGDIITVIGGGSLSDTGAFCASIYKRGARLTLIPTTLLAMIDAAIGGKTAVNLNGFKNCAGTFYMADEIIICPEFLKTLHLKEIENGLFEALKYAALFSATMFDKIITNQPALKKFDGFENKEQNRLLFSYIIEKCVYYKNLIIQKDPFDKYERLALNFGHTLGHAFESVSDGKIPHGAAVGLGMFVELLFARSKYGESEENKKLTDALLKFIRNCSQYRILNAAICRPDIFDKLHKYVINDKKIEAAGGSIRMPVVKKPGIYRIEEISINKEIGPFLKSREYILKTWRGGLS